MPTIVVQTLIAVSSERCFDAARDIGLHCRSVAHTGERAVAGVTEGLIGPGQSVTFEGTHFGIRQRFTAQVTEFDRPHRFVDEMTRGAFASMHHAHEFMPQGASTLMRDIVTWRSPLGLLGRLVDALVLRRHLTKLITRRALHLKEALESES